MRAPGLLLLLAGLSAAGGAQAALVSTLDVVAPGAIAYPTGHAPIIGSVEGDVTAALHAVDAGGATSGCEAADFAGFTVGTVALLRRGTCTFAVKALNAAAAGAAAAIIFNNIAGEFSGTFDGVPVGIPTLSLDRDIGLFLANAVTDGPTGYTVHLTVTDVPEPAALGLLLAGLAGLGALRRRGAATAGA